MADMAMPITTDTIMAADANATLFRLMSWLSPAYPVGAFSYSQGLETAIAEKRVQNATTLHAWIEDLASGGTLWSDAVIFARAHYAASLGQWSKLADIAAFALAFQPAAELKRETAAQGAAFLDATRAAWTCDALRHIALPCPYPVAVAAAAAGHGIDARPALGAYMHATAANLVSAAIRLIPLGQTEGQKVLAWLEDELALSGQRALDTPLNALATNCIMADIMAMRHETLEPRLFRS